MDHSPAFTAGDDSWTVAADGKSLMIKGQARHARTDRAEQVSSLIPVISLTHASVSRHGPHAKLAFRLWDGDEYYVGVTHNDAADVIAGLQGLVAEVATVNASWPMSSARAAAARAQTKAGLLRDRCFLGEKGKEEFWSPLSDLPWTWANVWANSPCGSCWPIAAVLAKDSGGEVLVALTADATVVIDGAANVASVPFDSMSLPEIVLGSPPPVSHEGLDVPWELGLRVSSPDGSDLEVTGIDSVELQPVFRYLLMRWAEREAAQSSNPVDRIALAATDLGAGRMTAVAYSALIDALVAAASGVPMSREFPPRERDYLRPASPVPGVSGLRTGSPRPVAPTQAGGGVNARQVAAGAAAGAALISILSG